jgi:hypothetical protein
VRALTAAAIVAALVLAQPVAESAAGAPGDPGPPVAAKHRKKHRRPRCSRRHRVSRRHASRSARRCGKRRHRQRRRQAQDRPPLTSPVLPGEGGGSTPGGPGPQTPLSRYVSVSAREWSLTLSRPLVGAGKVTVELRNVGEDPHDLVLSPDDGSHTPLASFPETGSGGLTKLGVTLPAGRYLLWCSLPGHEALGMRAKLQVGS